MNIKSIILTSLTSIVLVSNSLAWRGYNLNHYSGNDFRYPSWTSPFPIIFHYNQGGTSSNQSYEVRITDEELSIDILPENIKQKLAEVTNVEVYKAYCKLEQAECNYFTHAWSMDRMIEDRKTYIESGIYEPKNLEAVDGEIGINSLIEQEMSFHNAVYLSGNSARFKINDMNKIAEGWFVAYYNPNKNANCGNSAINQKKKAIVVHWTFIPKNLFDAEKLPDLANVIQNWDTEDIRLVLEPQFSPAL